jgi:pimeloyl-ACP methyl ester carboxylesterase
VLVATSGGVDVARLRAVDWRPDYRLAHPRAPSWITDPWPDHTADIPRITIPTLLIWGDHDPISPVAVGEYLATLLPRPRLVIVPGGTHAFATEQPALVAAHISDHLGVDGR